MTAQRKERITVRLFERQPDWLQKLEVKFNTNSADVMRIALNELFKSTFEDRNQQTAFVIELGGQINSWLDQAGFSNNLRTNQRYASTELGGTPYKFITERR